MTTEDDLTRIRERDAACTNTELDEDSFESHGHPLSAWYHRPQGWMWAAKDRRFLIGEVDKLLHDLGRLHDAANSYLPGHLRYEYVRTLNPRQFAELHGESVTSGIHFDKLVDERMKQRG
jgi:hypothetical protein